jgi:hypothetical protein
MDMNSHECWMRSDSVDQLCSGESSSVMRMASIKAALAETEKIECKFNCLRAAPSCAHSFHRRAPLIECTVVRMVPFCWL